MEQIPGILILKANKTYGRTKTTTNKPGRLLYKFIPNDSSLPPRLVPYEIKHLGFSKVLENLYVIISNENKLLEVIGPVTSNESYYKYQLHCANLFESLTTFKNTIVSKLKNISDPIEEIKCKYNLETRTDLSWYVFSIDPEGSKDFDDAFSIKVLPNTNILLSIYIANVPIWLDYLEISDELRKVSTIYLPNEKYPMLPTILSDDLCSLWAKKPRIAFTLDLQIDNLGNIIDKKFSNTLVQVRKNWTYDDPNLLTNESYLLLLEIIEKMSSSKITDSHKLVEHLMIQMNCICGKILFENKLDAIYRQVAFEENNLDIMEKFDLPEDIANTIQIIKNTKSAYIKNRSDTPIAHKLLKLESYIHITSPIRRLVDIINMGLIQQLYLLVNFNEQINNFLLKWTQDEQIQYINETSKKIRSVQSKCNLLNWITSNYIPNTILEGYVIDDETLYIPEYKLQCKLPVLSKYNIYSKHSCKLYIFEDGENLKKKIRVEIL
jgi:exoribonuclease R